MLRLVSTAGLMASAVLVSSAARPELSPVPDPDLFVSAGCAGCHGAAAAGAFGPTLAGTDLTFEAFLQQLRSPRGMMPPVAPGLVSDEQARSLFEFVAALEVPEGGPIAGAAAACGHRGRGRRGACRHGACAHPGSAAG